MILTVNINGVTLADRRRHGVAGYTEVHAHLLPKHPRQFQCLAGNGFHSCNQRTNIKELIKLPVYIHIFSIQNTF